MGSDAVENILISLGKSGLRTANYILELSALFLKSVLAFFRLHPYTRKVIWSNTVKQILFTGVDGLFVISTVSALLGMVIIIQAYTLLPGLGSDLIASLLVLVLVRELGPLLTAFIIIGRSGTAVSTEIGNMKVSHEIDALHSMGIDPIRFIVAPRLLGMIISMSLLGIYFDVVGILGGYIVARLQISLPFDSFLQSMLQVIQIEDIYIGLVKNIFFGIAISMVSCYQGMQVRISITEVPQRTTKAVVSSIFFCFLFDIIFTVAFYI